MFVLEAGRGQKNITGREGQTIKHQHANLFLNLKMTGHGCDMPQSMRLWRFLSFVCLHIAIYMGYCWSEKYLMPELHFLLLMFGSKKCIFSFA